MLDSVTKWEFALSGSEKYKALLIGDRFISVFLEAFEKLGTTLAFDYIKADCAGSLLEKLFATEIDNVLKKKDIKILILALGSVDIEYMVKLCPKSKCLHIIKEFVSLYLKYVRKLQKSFRQVKIFLVEPLLPLLPDSQLEKQNSESIEEKYSLMLEYHKLLQKSEFHLLNLNPFVLDKSCSVEHRDSTCCEYLVKHLRNPVFTPPGNIVAAAQLAEKMKEEIRDEVIKIVTDPKVFENKGIFGFQHIADNWQMIPFKITLPSTLTGTATESSEMKLLMPNVYKIVKLANCSSSLNISISIFKGKATMDWHEGWSLLSKNILRCHIPLLIEESGLDIMGKRYFHKMGKAIMFDDTFVHRGFNNTDKIRAVLLVDVSRPSTALPMSKRFIPIDRSTLIKMKGFQDRNKKAPA